MIFEDMPDEWKEWIDLTPIERFRQSEKIFAQYLAMGGSLDPDPDPTSPFYDPETAKDTRSHLAATLSLLGLEFMISVGTGWREIAMSASSHGDCDCKFFAPSRWPDEGSTNGRWMATFQS